MNPLTVNEGASARHAERIRTLDSTAGLLDEAEFRNASGLTQIARYRRRGLIKPVGFARTNTGMTAFYHPRQITELMRELGVTLKSIEGLLSEARFRTASGLSGVARYRKSGLIKPIGFAMAGPGISAFYHERQIAELKKQLGITLESTQGLLNEDQFIAASGLTNIPKYRRRGLIKPVGKGMSATNLSHFYHPRQIDELKQKLGITLKSTEGLLIENVLRRMPGLDSITRYRKRGLIKPAGFALGGPGLCTYYHPRQVAELYSRLGVTLQSTKGLLNEYQFRKASGISRVADYRKAGLIKPVGFGMTGTGVGAFYHLRQIPELQQKLGITIKSTRGLLNEGEVRQMSGMTNITKYRERGLIKPVGFSNTHGGISAFYHPRQIAKLNKKLASLKSQKAASAKR